MPIEIRELVIQATIQAEEESRDNSSKNQESGISVEQFQEQLASLREELRRERERIII